jgi:AcrR family transcriptional regulator
MTPPGDRPARPPTDAAHRRRSVDIRPGGDSLDTAGEHDGPATVYKKRRPERLDQIRDAAIHLFYERGYQSTSMEDVANAIGMSGPSIYRHFKNKLEILEAALQSGGDQIIHRVDNIVHNAASPEETLDRLVRNLVRAVLNKPELVAVVLRERHNLSLETRRWFERMHRMHVEEWVHSLVELRPDLSDSDARTMVRAVISMVQSAADYFDEAQRDRLEDLLISMSLASLLDSRAIDVRTAGR